MINIESIHFTADQKLLNHIENRLSKVEQRYPEITSIKVKLTLENTGQIKDKIAEVIVQLPKHTFLAKGTSKTFEQATTISSQNLLRQLKEFKSRLIQSSRISGTS